MNAQLQPEVPAETATPVAEYSPTAAALADLRTKFAGVVFDVKTTAGMKAATAARAELRDLRVSLDKTRKEIKAPALQRCQLIDSEARRITAILESLEDPIDAQIKAEEKRKEDERAAKLEAERQRVAAIMADIATIRAATVKASTMKAAGIEEVLRGIEADDLARFTEPAYRLLADQAKADTVAALGRMLAERQAFEAEQVRQAEERAELERLAKAEADRIAAERAELERQQAEQRRKDEAAAAERDRLARIECERIAIEREKAEKEQAARDAEAAEARRKADAEAAAERDRLAKIEQERIEAENKRLADEQAEKLAALRAQQAKDDADRKERQRIEDEARAAEQARLDAEREAFDAEQRAIRAEAEREAREKAEREAAERAQREQERIDAANLVDAAVDAVELLGQVGQGEHVVTRALAAALARENQMVAGVHP